MVSVDGTESFEIVPEFSDLKTGEVFWDQHQGRANIKAFVPRKIKDIIGVKDEVVEKAKEF